MNELANRDVPYVREEKLWEDAVEYFKAKGDQYKLELLDEFKGQTITLYPSWQFHRSLRGPHLPSTGKN